ncbi:MAG: hypothetical protein RBU45_05590 [Myxococcota bacterium]|jgi:hypothetical protein|nr:hypothetical protein [Myxococcota bacterium]
MKQDTFIEDLEEEEDDDLGAEPPPHQWPGQDDAPVHRLIFAELLGPSLAQRLAAPVSLCRAAAPGPDGKRWRKVPWCRH